MDTPWKHARGKTEANGIAQKIEVGFHNPPQIFERFPVPFQNSHWPFRSRPYSVAPLLQEQQSWQDVDAIHGSCRPSLFWISRQERPICFQSADWGMSVFFRFFVLLTRTLLRGVVKQRTNTRAR